MPIGALEIVDLYWWICGSGARSVKLGGWGRNSPAGWLIFAGDCCSKTTWGAFDVAYGASSRVLRDPRRVGPGEVARRSFPRRGGGREASPCAKRLEAAREFADIARASARGVRSRPHCGDLRVLRRAMDCAVSEPLSSWAGEVFRPVRRQFRWHVITVEERRETDAGIRGMRGVENFVSCQACGPSSGLREGVEIDVRRRGETEEGATTPPLAGWLCVYGWRARATCWAMPSVPSFVGWLGTEYERRARF